MSRHFGPVRQVGYIVRDVEESIRTFVDVLGVGPFFTMLGYPVMNYEFEGRRSEPVVNVAVAYSGPVQIELIQPLGEAPSLYRELLAEGRPGPHYVTYWVRDLERGVADATRGGARVVQSGGASGAGKFAYLRDPRGALFELLETTDFIEAWFGNMQSVAASWDGTDPVRPAMP